MVAEDLTPNHQYMKAKGDLCFFYNYTKSKIFCQQIGLVWLGDEFIAPIDMDAWIYGFSQQQLDIAMRHHLWQVKYLFTPKVYSWPQRFLLVFYFLTGWKPK